MVRNLGNGGGSNRGDRDNGYCKKKGYGARAENSINEELIFFIL